jgi:hypothetical protein
MAEAEKSDKEPSEPSEQSQGAPKGTQFLKKGYRDLEEAELATPAAVRFLLGEIERLNGEIAEVKPFRERSYKLETRVALLEEKTKVAVAFEVLSSASLAIGAAIVGYSRYLWDTPPNGQFAVLFGIALMVGAFVAKAVKK